MSECKTCLGYGFWVWSHIAPMGRIDAEDGVPTIPCPECKANPNPVKGFKDRIDFLNRAYKLGILNFGEAKTSEEFREIHRKVNELYLKEK